MKQFWNVKAKDSDTGEVMLYGDISSSTWYGDEITPMQFKKDLDALGKVKNLNIYINSGGGDVFAGQAIYNMLARHEAFKTAYIDGLAASIASVIAMAGDRIIMPFNAMLMIHNAWTVGSGNSRNFRKLADELDKIDESINIIYEQRTGLSKDVIKTLSDAETWFSAEEAVAKGFADEVEKERVIAASISNDFFTMNGLTFPLERYKNKPMIQPIAILPMIQDAGAMRIMTETITTSPETTALLLIDGIPLNENRAERQPVSDMKALQELRKKINS